MRLLLVLSLVCRLFAAMPVRYGDSQFWCTIQRRADSVFATDVYVPTVLNLASLVSTAHRSDGQDIVVTDATGAYVVRQIPQFSKATSTGQLWYRDPACDSITGGTLLYLQWGGPTVNVNDTTGVWAQTHGGTVSYPLVMHFEADVGNAGTATLAIAAKNSPSYDSITSPLGAGIAFDGANQWVSILHDATIAGGNGATNNSFSYIIWCRYDNYTASQWTVTKGMGSGTLEYSFLAGSVTGYTRAAGYDGSSSIYRGQNGKCLDAGTWRQYCFTYAGGTGSDSWRIYVNAQRLDSANHSAGTYVAMGDDQDTLGIGRYSSVYMDGSIAEVQMAQTNLSEGQIRNAYANQAGYPTNASLAVGTPGRFTPDKRRFPFWFGFHL